MPSIANAHLTKYAGQTVTSPPSRATFPNGLVYTCAAGHSSNGSPSGHTQLSARVDSTGALTPALVSECKPIKYTISGAVKDSRNGGLMNGVKVSVDGTDISTTAVNGYFTLDNVQAGTARLVYENSDYIRTVKTVQVEADVHSGGTAD